MISITRWFDLNSVKEIWEDFTSAVWTAEEQYFVARWGAIADSAETFSVVDATAANAFTSNLFVYNLIINFTYVFCLALGFAVYLANQGLRAISHHLSDTDTHHVAFSYLTDLEEEVGSLDDAMMYFLMFGVIIIWFFFFTIFSTFFVQNISWVIMLLNFILLTAIFTPVMVLKSFGLSFAAYVRGAGRTSNPVVEVFFDFIAVAVVMARFIIQNIRLVMLFAAFFELSEFIYDNCDLVGSSHVEKLFSLPTLWNSTNLYWYDIVSDFLVQQILLIYYQGHLIVTFFAQLANYFMLSFTLFFFLYITFVLESHEKYFLYTRMQN